MVVVAHILVWLNAVANALGRILLAPLSVAPGWLSATLVGAASGVLLLAVFKYTSSQGSIKRVRSDIKANLLALRLFKDSAVVAMRAQGNILVGAFWLLLYAIIPMVVMFVPVLLILGQLALWYQSRPLRVGEEAILTLKLQGNSPSVLPDVRLEPETAIAVVIGPVRVQSQQEMCWNVQARENGYHNLRFQVGGQTFDKGLAVGDGFMRVSIKRPGLHGSDLLLHPAEEPFAADSPVQSIEITYPKRTSWTSGTDRWVIYWFAVSMVSAFGFRGLLKVNI
jgi:hypothetical protein